MIDILTGTAFDAPKRMHHREDEPALEFPSSVSSRARGLLALKAQNWGASGGTMDVGQILSDWFSGTIEGALTITATTNGFAARIPNQNKLRELHLPNMTTAPNAWDCPLLEVISAPSAIGALTSNNFVRMPSLRYVDLRSITSIGYATFNGGLARGIEIVFGNITSIAMNFIVGATVVGARIHIAKTQADIRAMSNFPFGLPSDTVFVGTDGEFTA